MSKPAYHHGDLKNALLAKAIEIIQKEGSEKITLRRLGKEVGVSAMAAYRHFANKEELLQSVAQQGFEVLARVLKETKAKDPKQRLVKQGVAYIAFALDHPAHYQLMFASSENADWGESLKQAAQFAFQQLVVTISECKKQNKMASRMNELQAALICWGQVHGAADICLTGQLPAAFTLTEYAKQACRNCVRGLFD